MFLSANIKLFVMYKNLGPEQALQKIKQFCAYQERCHFETKEKLFTMGLFKTDVERILSTLIEENYLNEERYAQAFAGGHFRQKKWGRVKIEAALKQKRVSTYNIRKGLKEIDEKAYLQCLQQLTTTKWTLLKGQQYLNRMAKTTSFLLQRGFELPLVQQAIAEIRHSEKDKL
jgi:regulatory protein